MNKLKIVPDLDREQSLGSVFRGIFGAAETVAERIAEVQGVDLELNTQLKAIGLINGMQMNRYTRSSFGRGRERSRSVQLVSNGRFHSFLDFHHFSPSLDGDNYIPDRILAYFRHKDRAFSAYSNKIGNVMNESVRFGLEALNGAKNDEHLNQVKSSMNGYGYVEAGRYETLDKLEESGVDTTTINHVNKTIRMAASTVISILDGNDVNEVMLQFEETKNQLFLPSK